MSQTPRILYCHCAYADVLPADVKSAVFRGLAMSGLAFEAVADLCELAARKDPRLRRIAESPEVRIAACFPRAVRWLFHAAGAPLPADGVEVFNMRTLGADEVVSGLLRGIGSSAGVEGASRCRCQDTGAVLADEGTDAGRVGDAAEANAAVRWIPWFPVIDYDRCGACKQCLSFCLFGVYAVGADERVGVRNPTHCKTNCPACARVCPNVAIIFPKYDKAPINGDEVGEEDVPHDPVKVNAARLFEGGVRAALRARGEPERRMKIQTDLDIPDRVLADILGENDAADRIEPARTADKARATRDGGAGRRACPSSDTVWDI